MRHDDLKWRPYREPLRRTLSRTGAIALVAGVVFAQWTGGLALLPAAVLLMLWPSLGGHVLEVGFLNGLRPRLPRDRAVQVLVRMGVWFLGGIALGFAAGMTAAALSPFSPARWPVWWVSGIGFVGVELTAHAALQARGRPSFYNGRG